MKRALLVLLLPAVAAAETSQPGPLPDVAEHESDCSDEGPYVLRTLSARAGKRGALVLHDCGFTPAKSHVAIETAAGWVIVDGFTISDSSHMATPPFHIRETHEALVTGTRDGAPSVTYVAISEMDEDDDTATGKVTLRADVMICRAGRKVRCKRMSFQLP